MIPVLPHLTRRRIAPMRCKQPGSFAAVVVVVLATTTSAAWSQASLTPLQRDCDRYKAPDPGEGELFKNPAMIQWRMDLSRHLARFKPPSGLLRDSNVQRITYVSFATDAKGVVIESKVSKGSGSPELDEAALRSVRSASPFPPAPAGFARPRSDFEIPFNFNANIAPRFSFYNPDGIGCRPNQPPQLAQAPQIGVSAADATKSLSQADEETLRKGIAECWRSTATGRFALRLRLSPDGSLSEPPTAEDKSENGRLAATTAGGQLMACKAFALDQANYATWRDIIVTHGPGLAEAQRSTTQSKPAPTAR